MVEVYMAVEGITGLQIQMREQLKLGQLQHQNNLVKLIGLQVIQK